AGSACLELGQQGADLFAPAGVGDLPAGPRRSLQGPLEVDDRFVASAGFGEVFAVEEVRIDALRIHGQGLLQQLAGLDLVAEAYRPSRHLVVKDAEAVVGRAVEGVAIDLDRLLVK